MDEPEVWLSRTPTDAADLFRGSGIEWWIAGGWAIDAFTGSARPHEDLDPSILRTDVCALVRHVWADYEVGMAEAGEVRVLQRFPAGDADVEVELPPGCGNLWLRRRNESAWEFDVLLSAGSATEWVYRRDSRIRMPMSSALWSLDGLRYLQPELQLLFKAKGLRPKDDVDFARTLPRLGPERRSWLSRALKLSLSCHPWIERLA